MNGMGSDGEAYPTESVADRYLNTDACEEFEFDTDTSPAYITDTVDRVTKRRVYVADEDAVPDGARAQEGPEGGIYYDTADLTGERSEEVQDRAEEARGEFWSDTEDREE